MSRLQALRDALRPLGIYKLEKGTLFTRSWRLMRRG